MTDTIQVQSNQYARSWLVVWRWPRWALVAAIISLPIFSALAYPPTLFALTRLGITDRYPQQVVLCFTPMNILYKNVAAYQAISNWEMRSLESVFGPVRPTESP